jgi:serine/threonine protein kinase
MALQPDQMFSLYRVIEKIDEGGRGEVWLAQQEYPVERTLTLKIIKKGLDSQPIMARFEAECQALPLMDHPAIAKIYDVGTSELQQAGSPVGSVPKIASFLAPPNRNAFWPMSTRRRAVGGYRVAAP